MVRHIAAFAVFALLPVQAWAQQCTSNVNTVVDAIYRQILDRPGTPDASGWVQQLNQGVTVKEVIRQIAKSEEHLNGVGSGTSNIDRQRATIYVYDHLLGRRASTAEVRDGSMFIQRNSVSAMIDGALDSAEYTEKWGDWGVPGSSVVFCNRSSGLSARPRGTSGTSGAYVSFDRADRNRDGRVTLSEWDDTRQSFRTADANRDNVLSREEFNASLGVSGAVGTSGTSRNDQFDQLDANRNNRIERGEWRESGETFNWLDRNGDGWLSRGEVVGRR